jgi:predicted RND superfamily exporter protein
MDMFGYSEFYKAAKSVFSKYDTQLRFSAVGNPPLMGFLTSVLLQLQTLGAGVIAVFAFLLWALFRSASAVIWPVTTILVSIIWM